MVPGNTRAATRAREPAVRGGEASGRGLRLVEVTAKAEAERRGTYRVVLGLGSAAVEVDDNFREDTLARLLAVVGRC